MSLTSMEYRTDAKGPSARKADHLRTNEDVGEAELFQPVRRFERLRQSAPALDLMAGSVDTTTETCRQLGGLTIPVQDL